MRFEQIRRLLGQETIADIQGAIVSLLEASRGDDQAVCALREFLVGMLAAIVTTRTYLPQSEQLAAEDAGRLEALVRKVREITPYQSAAPMSARVIRLAPHRADTAPVAAQPAKVISLPSTTPTRPVPVAKPVTGRDSTSPVAGVSAAKMAIARKKDLTAEKREILARSRVLLAHARSLRVSLEVVQQRLHS